MPVKAKLKTPKKKRGVGRPKLFSDAQIIRALHRRRGLIYLAAKDLKCAPQSLYSRAKANPLIQECIVTRRAEIVDKAEEQLFKLAEKGDHWGISMVLYNLARDRGYMRQQEL